MAAWRRLCVCPCRPNLATVVGAIQEVGPSKIRHRKTMLKLKIGKVPWKTQI